jgi:hypothetical protein
MDPTRIYELWSIRFSIRKIKPIQMSWLAMIGVLMCVVAVSAAPAQAYTAEITPWDECYVAGRAALAVLERGLTPSNEAAVQDGSSVVFSGSSASPVTFAVASSPELASSPDIDSGLGVQQPAASPADLPSYSFTSTKAAATPRTVYWTASLSTASIPECAGLSATTLTTSVRTLTVLPAPPVASSVAPAPAPPAVVMFAGAHVAVAGKEGVVVGLRCEGGGLCAGRLTLQGKRTVEGRRGMRVSRVVTIGTANFSIAAGESGSVAVHLNSAGRTLLKVGRGRLAVSLRIEPASGSTQVKTVLLLVKPPRRSAR